MAAELAQALLTINRKSDLLAFPKFKDGTDFEEWENEAQALVQHKYKDVGIEIMTAPDRTYTFDELVAATANTPATYTVTDQRLPGNTMPDDEIAIEEHLYLSLRAAARGEALKRINRSLSALQLIDPSGVHHVGPGVASLKTSAHLTYKALLSLNTDEYDQRILEFKRIQCTDPNKLISHFDELLRAYNRTMVSLPAPAYALTIEPELASAALLSVPTAVRTRIETLLQASGQQYSSRTFAHVRAKAESIAKDRAHLQAHKGFTQAQIEAAHAAMPTNRGRPSNRGPTKAPRSDKSPPKRSSGTRSPNLKTRSTRRARQIYCDSCGDSGHHFSACKGNCKFSGCNGKGGRHRANFCPIGNNMREYQRQANVAEKWGDRDSDDAYVTPDDEANMGMEEEDDKLFAGLQAPTDELANAAGSDVIDSFGVPHTIPPIDPIAQIIRTEHPHRTQRGSTWHDLWPSPSACTDEACAQDADCRLPGIRAVNAATAEHAMHRHFDVDTDPECNTEEFFDAPTRPKVFVYDAPEHPFCSAKGYQKFARRHCQLTPNLSTPHSADTPSAPQAALLAAADTANDTYHATAEFLSETAAVLRAAPSPGSIQRHATRTPLALLLYGLALSAQALTSPCPQDHPRTPLFTPRHEQQAYQLRREQTRIRQPWRPRQPGGKSATTTMTLPDPPIGWKWSSTAIDSGCTIHLIPDKNVYTTSTDSNIRIRTADNSLTHAGKEGAAMLHTFDTARRPVSLALQRAVCNPSMKSLLSVSMLHKMKCDVHLLHDRPSYIETPTGHRINAREDERTGLFYLDFLVPDTKMTSTSASTHPDTDEAHAHSAETQQPIEHADFATPPANKHVVEICAGTCSALRWHAQDPHAQLLAIDVLPEQQWRRLMSKVATPATVDRIQYVELDVTKLTPREYDKIIRTAWDIAPADVDHVWISPPCESFSVANRNKKIHYTCRDNPVSDVAKKHLIALTQVADTMLAHYQPGCRTLVQFENPRSRFRRMPVIKRLLSAGYQLSHADHCMLRDPTLDGLFPKKPTDYITLGQLPDYTDDSSLKCRGQCSCCIPGTKLHKHIICFPVGGLHDPRQQVIRNVYTKGMIPQGVIAHFYKAHLEARHNSTPAMTTSDLILLESRARDTSTTAAELEQMTSSLRTFGRTLNNGELMPENKMNFRRSRLLQLTRDIRQRLSRHTACPADIEDNDADDMPAPITAEIVYDPVQRSDPSANAQPIEVDVTLVPPTHVTRMHALEQPVLWHRRYGHIGGQLLRDTQPHVSGLRKHRSPKFCECCVRAKLARAPTPKHIAERPNASKPLGQVSVDTIEYSIRSGETTQALSGAKFASVFVDGASRFRFVVPMKRKSDSLLALQKFIQQHGQPEEILCDWGTEYKGQFEDFCTKSRIRLRHSCTYRAYMNGLVERSNRVLKTVARAILIDANLPPAFWAHALMTAAHIVNRTAGRHGPTPLELFNGTVPDVSHLRVFGSPCFAYIEKDLRRPAEHSQKAEPCIFIGYDDSSPSYLLYRPSSRHVISRAYTDVVFDEAHTNPADVLLGRYTRTVEDLLTDNPFVEAAPRPHKQAIQSDVDKLFKPSVHLPSSSGVTRNNRWDTKIVNICGERLTKAGKPKATADYIRKRCATIAGLTFNQAKHKRFVDARGRLRYYNRTDFEYDISHSHIRLDTAEHLTDAEAHYLRYSVRQTREFRDALSLVQTGDEPLSYQEMQASNDYHKWLDANRAEWEALKRYDCFEWVDPDNPDEVPTGTQLLTSKWVWKRKPDRHKSRICIRGFLQSIRDVGETYAPVCRMETIRTLLSLSVARGWSVRQADITNAYIRAPLLGAPVFMEAPEGVHDIDPDAPRNKVLRLKKSLYGLKAAGRNWYHVLKTYLESQGLHTTSADACLYVNAQRTLFIGTWVDDLCIVGDQAAINTLMQGLRQRFGDDGVKDLGRPNDFLGMQLTWSNDSVKLSQPRLIERMLRRFDRTPAYRSSPMPEDCRLTSVDHADTKPDHTEYRSLVGSLNYVANTTRADVSFSVHQLSRHMANPSHAHLKQAYRVLDYLAQTRHSGPTYSKSAASDVIGFSDADWAGQVDDRRSTSGQVFMLNGACITWASRAQNAIALSTAEAEWYALCDCGKSAIWLRRLLRDIGIAPTDPTLIKEDSTSAIKWSTESAAWSRTRHIDIKHHAVRQWIESKQLQLEYCKTDDMLADLFTKPLNSAKHKGLAGRIFGQHTSKQSPPAA